MLLNGFRRVAAQQRAGVFGSATSAALRAVGCRHASGGGDSHFIISATGPDRTGIVFEIARVILDNNGDIGESRMTRMGGDFSVMMRITASRQDADTIVKKLQLGEAVGKMHVVTHPVSSTDYNISPKAVFKASFEVEGVNHPGLVYKVTEIFFKRGLRVDELYTDTKLAPFGGSVLFMMNGVVISDKEIDVNELQEATEALAHKLGIDVEVTPIKE